MKVKAFQDTDSLHIEVRADRVIKTWDTGEYTPLAPGVERRACALSLEHFRQGKDGPDFSYEQMAALHLCRICLIRSSRLSRPLSAAIPPRHSSVASRYRRTKWCAGRLDVDFLADADDADRLHQIVLALGYRYVHRSEDAANYVRDDEGLDLRHAHQPVARRLPSEAIKRETVMGCFA